MKNEEVQIMVVEMNVAGQMAGEDTAREYRNKNIQPLCGFAAVRIKLRNRKLVKQLEEIGIGSRDGKSYRIPVYGHGQNAEAKEDHADAMCKVLHKHGIGAWTETGLL